MKKVHLIYSNEATQDVSIVGSFKTEDQAFENIMSFLDECNYRSYYQRFMQISENVVKIDFGSHIQFYYQVIGTVQDAEDLIEKVKNGEVY